MVLGVAWMFASNAGHIGHDDLIKKFGISRRIEYRLVFKRGLNKLFVVLLGQRFLCLFGLGKPIFQFFGRYDMGGEVHVRKAVAVILGA